MPLPFSSPNIVPCTSRWIDHKGTSDLRLYIDDFSSFVTRPFTIVPEGGILPHYYRHEVRHYKDIRGLQRSALSWFLFLRSAELPYFTEDDEFGTVSYAPQRVMRQFGFDQHHSFSTSDSGDYEEALDNFIPASASFSWEIPRPPHTNGDPLPFIIPSATRQGHYDAGERNRWLLVTKMWLDETLLIVQVASPPRQLEWSKLLCAPKSNPHPEKWPVSARLLEREAFARQPSPRHAVPTSHRPPSRASSHAPPRAPPQGPSVVEGQRLTRSRARGPTTTTHEVASRVVTIPNLIRNDVVRRTATGTTIILRPFSKRPSNEASPTIPVTEDPPRRRRKLMV